MVDCVAEIVAEGSEEAGVEEGIGGGVNAGLALERRGVLAAQVRVWQGREQVWGCKRDGGDILDRRRSPQPRRRGLTLRPGTWG